MKDFITLSRVGLGLSLASAAIMGASVVSINLSQQNREAKRQSILQTAAKEALANRYVNLEPQPLLTVNATVSLPDGVGGKLPYSLVHLNGQWGFVEYQNGMPTIVTVFTAKEIEAAQSNLNVKKEG